MKKVIVLIFAVLVCGFIMLYLISCIPHKIDLKYPAIQYYEDNTKEVKNITIEMKGKLYKPLFGNPKYVGSCVIEGYDFTKNYQLTTVVFDEHVESRPGILSYATVKKLGIPDSKIIGQIWMSGNFDKLCVYGACPEDIESTSFEPINISAPAKTTEEAINIANELR